MKEKDYNSMKITNVQKENIAFFSNKAKDIIGRLFAYTGTILLIIKLLVKGLGMSMPDQTVYMKQYKFIWILFGTGFVSFLLLFLVGKILSTDKQQSLWKDIYILFIFILNIISIKGEFLTFNSVITIVGISVLLYGLCLWNYLDKKAQNPQIAKEYEQHLVDLRDDKVYLSCLLERIENEDLRERIANEVYSYVFGAVKYKKRFYYLTTLSIVLPAMVVAINSIDFIPQNASTVVVSLLSMIVVIVTGILSTMKAKESWARYRKYAELSKREIVLYLMKVGQYNACLSKEEREKILVNNLEEIFASEQENWNGLRGS